MNKQSSHTEEAREGDRCVAMRLYFVSLSSVSCHSRKDKKKEKPHPCQTFKMRGVQTGCVCCSGECEAFGEGFGERLNHGERGGVAGGDGVEGGCNCDCNCGCDNESDEGRGGQSSGFVFGGASSSVSGGEIIDRRSPPSCTSCSCSCSCSCPRDVPAKGSSGPVSCALPCAPMMSLTMRARSTLCEGDVSGSMRAEGGGQTLSWNIEPDSDARARSRRGGEDVDEGRGGSTWALEDCERE